MYAAEQRCIKAEDQYDGDECACHDATYSAHVVGKNGWIALDGHQVVVRFLAAFGRRCRPQFECPACARGCARLYNVSEAFHPWRCLRCAGLE
jgi:hypothetical protein